MRLAALGSEALHTLLIYGSVDQFTFVITYMASSADGSSHD